MKEEQAALVLTPNRAFITPKIYFRGFFMVYRQNNDIAYMKLALKLASKGSKRVFPNPMVGAVIVNNGKIVGRGYHRYFGGPHAEIYALEQAGDLAKHATLYVTLEPCAHWGKTPPCSDMLIRAGIGRVVAASGDPNPKTAGKGFKKLVEHGVKVDKNLLKAEAHRQNCAYFERFSSGQPHVLVKAAMSLDGKICTRTGDSKWISGESSRKLVHELRSNRDAVIVGINTVLKDNPLLTSHGLGKNPVRVVIDPDFKIPLTAKILNSDAPTIIFGRLKHKVKLEALNKLGVITVICPNKNRINFKYIINILNKMSIYSLLIEGGGETIAAAFEDKVVDEIMMFLSPIIIGGREAKTPVEGFGKALVSNAINVSRLKTRRIGKDILLTAKVR